MSNYDFRYEGFAGVLTNSSALDMSLIPGSNYEVSCRGKDGHTDLVVSAEEFKRELTERGIIEANLWIAVQGPIMEDSK